MRTKGIGESLIYMLCVGYIAVMAALVFDSLALVVGVVCVGTLLVLALHLHASYRRGKGRR